MIVLFYFFTVHTSTEDFSKAREFGGVRGGGEFIMQHQQQKQEEGGEKEKEHGKEGLPYLLNTQQQQEQKQMHTTPSHVFNEDAPISTKTSNTGMTGIPDYNSCTPATTMQNNRPVMER